MVISPLLSKRINAQNNLPKSNTNIQPAIHQQATNNAQVDVKKAIQDRFINYTYVKQAVLNTFIIPIVPLLCVSIPLLTKKGIKSLRQLIDFMGKNGLTKLHDTSIAEKKWSVAGEHFCIPNDESFIHAMECTKKPLEKWNVIKGAHNLTAFLESFMLPQLKDDISLNKIVPIEGKEDNFILFLFDKTAKKPEKIILDLSTGLTADQQKFLQDPDCCGFKIKDILAKGYGLKKSEEIETCYADFYSKYLDPAEAIKEEDLPLIEPLFRSVNQFLGRIGANEFTTFTFTEFFEKFYNFKPVGKIFSINSTEYDKGIYEFKYSLDKNSKTAVGTPKTITLLDKPTEDEKNILHALCHDAKTGQSFLEDDNSKKLFDTIIKGDECFELTCHNLLNSFRKKGIVKIIGKNSDNATIYAPHNGKIFAAYGNKNENDQYELTTFFPILHGSDMHKEALACLNKQKDGMDLCDITLIEGLEDDLTASSIVKLIKKLFTNKKIIYFDLFAIGTNWLTTIMMLKARKAQKQSDNSKV